MAAQFNFQQGRFDTGYGDSLQKLSSDFSTTGNQQQKLAQEAISEANANAYRNARAQAQDTQNAVQNQMGYDKLGVDKEQIAIKQFDTKAKNQAAYKVLVNTGNIKEPFDENVDYGTTFDAVQKDAVNKANIAQSRAAVNASNASAASANAQTSYFNNQVKAEEDFNKGYLNMSKPQTVDVPNPVYANIQNEYDKVNSQIKGIESGSNVPNVSTNNAWVNNITSKITSLEQLKNTAGLNPNQEVQLSSMIKARDNIVNNSQNAKVVPNSLVAEQQKLGDNLKTVPKTLQEQRYLTKEEASNQILNDTSMSDTAKFKLLNKLSGNNSLEDLVDNSSGSGGLKFGKLAGSTSDGSTNKLALVKYIEGKQANQESNAVTLNKIIQANPNLPKEEVNKLLQFKTSQGLGDYYSMNYDKDTGKLKNSPEGKQALVFKSLNDIISKDDTDNNTTGNITQFYASNQDAISKLSANELTILMDLVSNNYRSQSKSIFANIGDNSRIGDSLDNAVEKWNSLHPTKKLNTQNIGTVLSD